jgi:hypothetical protein
MDRASGIGLKEAGTAMTIKEVADLLFAARERIDFYWNFYVVVVIAVIGWIVSLKKTLSLSMKLLVTVAYAIAALMNLLGLYSSYTLAEALRLDLLRLTASTTLTDTTQFLQQHSYLPQRLTAILIHLAIGATILLVVWLAPSSEAESTPAKATRGSAEEKKPPQKHRRA